MPINYFQSANAVLVGFAAIRQIMNLLVSCTVSTRCGKFTRITMNVALNAFCTRFARVCLSGGWIIVESGSLAAAHVQWVVVVHMCQQPLSFVVWTMLYMRLFQVSEVSLKDSFWIQVLIDYAACLCQLCELYEAVRSYSVFVRPLFCCLLMCWGTVYTAF